MAIEAGTWRSGSGRFHKGSFSPSILEPGRRIDQALYAVVMEAYVHGVSTRSVHEVLVALGAVADQHV